MNLQIPKWQPAGISDFVTFWADTYSDDLEHLYNDNIGQKLNEDRVWSLYKWKNGSEHISEKKQQSIRTIYLPKLGELPVLTTPDSGKLYVQNLHGGAIWDIFWLHCVNPPLFPIFDQHTFRAMAKIDGLTPAEIPDTRNKKLQIYFDQYIPFVQRFQNQKPRQIDKALFAYGRFLKWGFAGR